MIQIRRAKGEEVQEKAPDTEDAMKRYKAGNSSVTLHLKRQGLIPRSDGTKKKSPKYENKEEQDRDVGKNKVLQPKKYYKGLDKKPNRKEMHTSNKKTGKI